MQTAYFLFPFILLSLHTSVNYKNDPMHLYKSTLLALLLISFQGSNLLMAQESKNAYEFTDVKTLAVTEVKNQFRSGTCWSFASLAMLEAEIIRVKGEQVDLSEMYIVRRTYEEKAKRYVRMHGHFNFSGGGAANDVTDMIAKYGIMPEEIYTGLNYGEDKHSHAEMDAILKAYLDQVIKSKKLSTAWFRGFQAILDTYLGEVPEHFQWKGKSYTPESFAKNYLNLDMEDYTMLSSFQYQKMHTPFILEVPDNWSLASSFNVSLDELIQCIDKSIEKGYTVTWATDISEKGFKWNQGVAICPDVNLEDASGTEREKWEELTPKEKEAAMFSLQEIVPEKVITAESRQEAFDNYETTDDHGMLICGIAKDEEGNKYYLVKNSWADTNPYKGYLYASESYVRYKTLSILLNKKALPSNLRSKM